MSKISEHPFSRQQAEALAQTIEMQGFSKVALVQTKHHHTVVTAKCPVSNRYITITSREEYASVLNVLNVLLNS